MRRTTPSRLAWTGLTLALALSTSGFAFAAAPEATMAKPSKTFEILSDGDFDPVRLIPPPPADGSERQKAELAEVQRAYGMSDTGRKALAQWDNDHEDVSLYAPTLGYAFDMEKLPATAKLMALVQNEASVASGRAKSHFKRIRPWAQDKTIVPCDAAEGGKPNTSYPSGHATIGYTVGAILVALIPEKSQAILERASDYAYSREICGDHFPSDTEASHVVATLVAARLLADPRVKPDLDAARAELQAAGIAAR